MAALHKALNVTLFRNGDTNFAGSKLAVDPHSKQINWDVFMDKVTERVKLSGTAYRLFTTDGTRIQSLAELEDGKSYVAAGKEAFKSAAYDSILPPKAKERIHEEAKKRITIAAPPRVVRSGRALKGATMRPRTIAVAPNGEQFGKNIKLVLNPRLTATFDQLLRVLSDRMGFAVNKLFTLEGEEIQDMASLEDGGQYVASNKLFKHMAYFSTPSTTMGGPNSTPPRSKTMPPTTVTGKPGHVARKENTMPPRKPLNASSDGKPEIATAKFDKLEKDIKALVVSKDKLAEFWKALDFNGNGLVSLAEIDKMVVERYPLLNNKPALMRAYKKTTLKDGDGDAWVEQPELGALIRNLFYFNKLFSVFDDIDKDDDRRMDLAEFKAGLVTIGMRLAPEEAEDEFRQIDENGGGLVLFDEFCTWVARRQCPVDGDVQTGFTGANKQMGTSAADGKKTTAAKVASDPRKHAEVQKFDKLEKEFKAMISSPEQLKSLWKVLDFSGNGIVSLAEIDKWVVEKYPLLNHKPALMRAYQRTTLKDGDGDAWVERHELVAFLRNLFYFNKLFQLFDLVDKDDDRRVDAKEFAAGAGLLGMKLSQAQAEVEFKQIDQNKGGQVLFDEFCEWAAKKLMPIDDKVAIEFRKKLADSEKVQGYNVTVDTGDQENAGTDAKVYITIVGSKGNSGRQLLTESSDNFLSGSSDVFAIESSSLGDIRKIVIEHDNSGAASAWFVKRVSVRDVITNKTYYFHCNRWLADDRGDMKVCVEVPASTSPAPEKPKGKGKGDDKTNSHDAEQIEDSEETAVDRPIDDQRAERVEDD